jgi:predicted NAD-dependent protein-ADP-ribosyltransferase YbiA (DUF1768 family)
MINRFVGRYKFLSNFYVHPVYFDGELYASSEHAYQAQKVIGPLHKLEVRTAITPAHPALRTLLLATNGHELVEGNKHGDTFWGVDLCTNVGDNHLGKLLMQVRDEL